jgi:hypothetical protein
MKWTAVAILGMMHLYGCLQNVLVNLLLIPYFLLIGFIDDLKLRRQNDNENRT